MDHFLSTLDSDPFLKFADYSPCIIIGLCSNGNIRWCNKAFLETSGYCKNEVHDKPITSFSPTAESQDRFRTLIHDINLGQEVSGLSVVIQCHDFDHIALTLNSVVSRDPDGHIAGAICFCKDTTKQKALEKNLEQAAQESLAVFDLSKSPVFGVDHRGAVSIWNAPLAALTSVPAEVRAPPKPPRRRRSTGGDWLRPAVRLHPRGRSRRHHGEPL